MLVFNKRSRNRYLSNSSLPCIVFVVAVTLFLYLLWRLYAQDISYFLQLVSCNVFLNGVIASLSKKNSSPAPFLPTGNFNSINSPPTKSRIPKIIHQMWKDRKSVTSEMKNWVSGCKALNPDYEFKFYDDEDLRNFVETTYPEYWSVYKSLTGVWMADMARLLIIYHYGGIYMDLDFHCVRPFSCIERFSKVENLLAKKGSDSDLMIVSLEPSMHSVVLYNKTRVVIQDFFMTTPKHPFFKWLLDDRNSQQTALGKKPFSYSVDKDIDRFKLEHQTKHHNSSGLGHSIIELPSNILHPLADSFNSDIFTKCVKIAEESKKDGSLYSFAKSYCEKYMSHDIFNPSHETLAVHMWAHVYFRWNLLRDPFEPAVRQLVYSKLPPVQECPAAKTW